MNEITEGWAKLPKLDLFEIGRSVTPHNGTRFSGWVARYEDLDPAISNLLREIGWDLGLKMREDDVWLNVLKGKGAQVESHTEGKEPTDITITLFLSTLQLTDGGLLRIGEKSFQPIEGKYVIFPSRMEHRVTPLRNNIIRYSAAALFTEAH